MFCFVLLTHFASRYELSKYILQSVPHRTKSTSHWQLHPLLTESALLLGKVRRLIWGTEYRCHERRALCHAFNVLNLHVAAIMYIDILNDHIIKFAIDPPVNKISI